MLPKTHSENGILPDYYAVVKTDKDLSSFELKGFLDTESMKSETFDYYYNSASLSQLISYNEFIAKIEKAEPVLFDASEHNLVAEEYLRLTDNEIDKDTKRELIKHMLQCEDCRRELCCFTGFEMVSVNTGKYPDLTEDKTLDIIAAQAVEKGEYSGKEEKIYIGDDEQFENPESDKDEFSVQDKTPVADVVVDEEDKSNDYEIIEEESESDNNDLLSGIAVAGAAGAVVATVGDEIKNSVVSEPVEDLTSSDILDEDINDILFSDSQDENVMQESETEDIIIDDGESMPAFIDNDNDVLTDEDAPVPDILDELFSIDETLPEIRTYEDNISQISDLSENDNEPGLNSEMVLKSDDDEDTYTDEPLEERSDVRKVIIDYDDDGEPVYSYVTAISDEDNVGLVEEEVNIIREDEEEDNLLLDDLDAENAFENAEDTAISEFASDDSEMYESDGTEEIDELTDDNVSAFENNFSNDYNGIEDETDDSGNNVLLSLDENSDMSFEEENDASDDDLLSTDDFTSGDFDEKTNFAESMYDSQVENFVNEEENDDDFEPDTESDEEDYDDSDEEDGENEEYEDDEYEDDEDEDYEEDGDENDDSLEFSDENNKGKKAGLAIIAAVLILLLAIGGAGYGIYSFIAGKGQNVAVNNSMVSVDNTNNNVDISNNDILPVEGISDDMIPTEQGEGDFGSGEQQFEQSNPQPQDSEYQAPPLTEQDLVPESAPLTEDPNKAITNAFSPNTPLVSFNGLNWQINTGLFTDKSFKLFLGRLDNSLKDKVKGGLMNASEPAPNNFVSVQMSVSNEGELINTAVTSSSGSEQIDNIVLQSIKESFDGQKTVVIPDGKNMSDKYNMVVVIKF